MNTNNHAHKTNYTYITYFSSLDKEIIRNINVALTNISSKYHV